jgi:enoyl-[acyl-carrier protein] reductase III
MWLEGRVALITGGSRGIGRATALSLATLRPAHLAVGYVLDHDAAQATVTQLQHLGVSASAHCADVSDEAAFREVFVTLQSQHGRLDLLISAAARASFSPLMEVSPRSWQRVMDLNARAFLLGAQCAAPLMKDGGRILGVTSLGARTYLPQYGLLGAAKAAIESLTRYLAVELAERDIRVNSVCGGFVDTDSTRMLPEFDEVARAIASKTPARRIGTPDDIAAVLALLCSSDSDWITGQTIVADGGLSLRQ